MEKYIEKAAVLIEALPYIQSFRGALVVVKLGGSVMEDPELTQGALRDIVFMECVGINPVVVHGGGKSITDKLKKLDIPTKFVHGLRHTCERTIGVVDDVLHNEINTNLVDTINSHGGGAIRLSGKDFLTARKLHAEDPTTGAKIDIGFVGDVCKVDTAPILQAVADEMVPVIAPLAVGEDGAVYNINADIAACKIAEALKARKLVFISDVPGILSNPKDEGSVISTLTVSQVDGLVASGVISGGMIPKVRSAVDALNAGTSKVHMIDGRIRHSLLLEIFTNSGVGTEIVK